MGNALLLLQSTAQLAASVRQGLKPCQCPVVATSISVPELVNAIECSGRLPAVVAHDAAAATTRTTGLHCAVCHFPLFKWSLLGLAARTGHAELCIALLRAGATPYIVGGYNARVMQLFLQALLDTARTTSDEAVAAQLRRMYAMLPCVGARFTRDSISVPQQSTNAVIEHGWLSTLKVLLELDPAVREDRLVIRRGMHPRLLCIAAAHHRPSIIAYLMNDLGMTLYPYDEGSPIAYSLCAPFPSPRVYDTLDVLLCSVADGEACVRATGVCERIVAPDAVGPVLPDLLLLVHITAAVGRFVPLPDYLAHGDNQLLKRCWSNAALEDRLDLQSLPLDFHAGAVYIRDPLRTTGAVLDAVAFAVALDALQAACAAALAVRAQLDEYNRAPASERAAAPRRIPLDLPPLLMYDWYASLIRTGASGTISAWALLRRRHALVSRKRVIDSYAV